MKKKPYTRESCEVCGAQDRSIAVNKKGAMYMVYVTHGLCQVCRLRRHRKAA